MTRDHASVTRWLSAQPWRDGVRGGVERDADLVVAAPGEPPGRRAALAVAPVHRPGPGRRRLDDTADRHTDAVAPEPDEHDPDPARRGEVGGQGVEHRPRTGRGTSRVVRFLRGSTGTCRRGMIGSQAAERHHDLDRGAAGGAEPDPVRGAVDLDEVAVPPGEPLEPAAQPLRLDLDRPAAAGHLPGPRHPATVEVRRSLVTRPGRLVGLSADPGVRWHGAGRHSYRVSSGRPATPPAGGWAAEKPGEPSWTGH